MKLKNMKKEDLEVLSYTDLTEMVLKENKKTMNTASIFKTICDLLELSEEDYSNSIGDFYTSLTTDKRFILLNDGNWDLREKHTSDKVIKVEEDEDELDNDDVSSKSKDDIDDEDDDYDSSDDFDDDDDDFKDLVILDEDELDLEQ